VEEENLTKCTKERNVRIFRNHSSTAITVFVKGEDEARARWIAGAKFLGSIMPGE
jgi:hypothetical protein